MGAANTPREYRTCDSTALVVTLVMKVRGSFTLADNGMGNAYDIDGLCRCMRRWLLDFRCLVATALDIRVEGISLKICSVTFSMIADQNGLRKKTRVERNRLKT